MKKFVPWMAMALAVATLAGAAESVNWVAALGRLAQDTTDIRSTMEQVEPADKQVFAARLLRAIRTMPLTREEKSARFARVAHELVAGVKTAEEKKATLCTIFAQVEAIYLADVSDTLARGLEIGRNGISQDDFLNIAESVIACVAQRTQNDPDAVIRLTMAAATFLRASGDDQKMSDRILASLGNTEVDSLVKSVVQAATKGDYSPMLQANADVHTVTGWFTGFANLPTEPLLHPLGTQFSWGRIGGGIIEGIEGPGYGGADALPAPAITYAGQTIRMGSKEWHNLDRGQQLELMRLWLREKKKSECACPPSNSGNPPKMGF